MTDRPSELMWQAQLAALHHRTALQAHDREKQLKDRDELERLEGVLVESDAHPKKCVRWSARSGTFA